MTRRDYTTLLQEMSEEYKRYSPGSAALQERAEKVMVDGVSHRGRLIRPFPPRVRSAKGAYITDVDGHRILDHWQGHFVNLLGHNPEVVTQALAQGIQDDMVLQTGCTDAIEVEVAELLCRRTGSERVRFTTSGTLATMYAIMIARSHTGRQLVLKVGGGWHGGQPWSLKGVHFFDAANPWQVESQGLPGASADEVIVTKYNNLQRLADDFSRYGDRLACFIVEPFVAGGGFILSDPEYLTLARRLCQQHGVVLILDEVMSGFRFRAGDTGTMYGVRPDLAVFGKIIGGGMPIAAVGGRADIMGLSGGPSGAKVGFSGGTFSSHAGTMRTARAFLQYLVDHETEIYPRIARLGEQMRRGLEQTFHAEGIPARCSGDANAAVRGSSVGAVHFPLEDGFEPRCSDDIFDPGRCDVALRDTVLVLGLLLQDVHAVFPPGIVTAAHTEADVQAFLDASAIVARRAYRS